MAPQNAETVAKATLGLLEYGILGLFMVLALGAIVYLVKQQKEMIRMVLESKDGEIAIRDKTIERHEKEVSKNNHILVTNQTQLIGLYKDISGKVEEISG